MLDEERYEVIPPRSGYLEGPQAFCNSVKNRAGGIVEMQREASVWANRQLILGEITHFSHFNSEKGTGHHLTRKFLILRGHDSNFGPSPARDAAGDAAPLWESEAEIGGGTRLLGVTEHRRPTTEVRR